MNLNDIPSPALEADALPGPQRVFAPGSGAGDAPTPSAAAYGWQSSQAPHACHYVTPKVLQILQRLGARRVVDIGAGNGALCAALVRAGHEVLGLEPDAQGAAWARRTAPGARIETLGVEADAALLREDHGAFDAVVSTEVIEHLHAPHRLPALAAGLLQPGGWLVVSTPFHGYWKNLALSLAGRWDHHHTALWYGGHVKFWSRRTLSQLLQDNGFEVVGFHGVGRLPWLWKSMVLVARRTSAEVGAGHARGA
jgi:2-polyprenyl-6-hydroxyphenyl methylase/3-demethylubiquinone-9 3-methyltransferase